MGPQRRCQPGQRLDVELLTEAAAAGMIAMLLPCWSDAARRRRS